MKAKTFIAVLLTAVITIVLMQNMDEVKFKVLFWEMYLPKLVILTGVAAAGTILGLMLGRPSRKTNSNTGNLNQINQTPHDTLSPEDRDYISD